MHELGAPHVSVISTSTSGERQSPDVDVWPENAVEDQDRQLGVLELHECRLAWERLNRVRAATRQSRWLVSRMRPIETDPLNPKGRSRRGYERVWVNRILACAAFGRPRNGIFPIEFVTAAVESWILMVPRIVWLAIALRRTEFGSSMYLD